jgi:thiol-disulfide isomerase/thioredoxin
MKRRTFIVGAAGLASMLAVGWFGWRESSRRAPRANDAIRTQPVVKPDPNAFFSASLPNAQGDVQAMAQWRGRPLVINFWATWCPPCVKEMPDLDELARLRPDVQFVGVAIDSAANVRDFIRKIPVSFPIVIAGHAGLEMVRALGNAAGGLPFTVLVDARGRFFDQILGPVEPVALDRQIQHLLTISPA